MPPYKAPAQRDTHACPGSSANKISMAPINQLPRSSSVGYSVWRTVCRRHSRWRRSRTIPAAHRQGRPLARGSLRGSLLEAPKAASPPALFSRTAVPNSDTPSAHNTQDAGRHGHGRGVGVAWNAAASMLYSVPGYVYTRTGALLSASRTGIFYLIARCPSPPKRRHNPQIIMALACQVAWLPGSQALPGLDPALVPQSREIPLQIESIYV